MFKARFNSGPTVLLPDPLWGALVVPDDYFGLQTNRNYEEVKRQNNTQENFPDLRYKFPNQRLDLSGREMAQLYK